MLSIFVKYDYESNLRSLGIYSLTHPPWKWILKVRSVHFLGPNNLGNDVLPPFRHQIFSLVYNEEENVFKKAHRLKKFK